MQAQHASSKLRDELDSLKEAASVRDGRGLARLGGDELASLEAELQAAARRVAKARERRTRQLLRLPDAFVCPVTREVMDDPVSCADGHTYERSAIQHWLLSHATSPKTGLPLDSKRLVPNFALRSAIDDYRAKSRQEVAEEEAEEAAELEF